MISLGLLETNSIARGVIAGDAMLKAAEVTLLKAGAVCPGKYTVVIYGEVTNGIRADPAHNLCGLGDTAARIYLG